MVDPRNVYRILGGVQAWTGGSAGARFLAVRIEVPGALVEVLDPGHPDAGRIAVSDPFEVPWNERLF